MPIYKTSKAVLSVQNNPAQFLNGLTSNVMSAPQNALLNIYGKIIAAFDQLKISDNEYWLVVEKQFMPDVMNHLNRYARISGVKLEEKNLNVYFDLSADYQLKSGECSIMQKKGKLILTPNELTADISEEAFTLFRVRNHIPLHGVDYKDEFLLNVSMADLVSFTKGCYLGQEPVAKVYNRSKPTWKLVVASENQCSLEEQANMTSRVKNPTSGVTMGFVFVKND